MKREKVRGRKVKRPKYQRRVRGERRIPASESLPAKVAAAVEAEARYYGVSRSWVKVVCCAIALEVPLTALEQYKPAGRVLRVVRGGKR